MKNATANKKPAAASNKAEKAAPAPTSTAATLAALNSAAPVQAAAQPIKKPAVNYVAGVAAGAPANAPVVTIAGAAYNGALPATNPANRGAVGTVKNPQAVLMAGNGKGPKVGHNLAYWQAVNAHLAANNGKATAQELANAAGHGGGAFIGYCIKNGWLAIK